MIATEKILFFFVLFLDALIGGGSHHSEEGSDSGMKRGMSVVFV